MQRNINNEIVAAVIAVAIITLALITASLLSNSFEEEILQTPEKEVAGALTVEIMLIEQTEQVALPTSTENVLNETDKSTEVITTETYTATRTSTATASPTNIASPANTAMPTHTSTVVPPTNTAIPPSQTPLPPTNTPAPPTATPTSTASATPTEPTQVIEAQTATIEPSLTPTDIVQVTQITPTEDVVTVSAMTSVRESFNVPDVGDDCEPPSGWVEYVIQPPDTLYGIALATDSSIFTLQIANCIGEEQVIALDDVIYLPQSPILDVPIIRPIYESKNLQMIGCNMPELTITNIEAEQIVGDTLTINATIQFTDIGYYKLEVRPNAVPRYVTVYADDNLKTDETIHTMNTNLIPNGINWLRLSVVDMQGQEILYATCEIPIIVE